MQSLPDCPLLNLIDGVSSSYFDRVKGNGSIQEVNILKLNLFLCDIREKRKLESTLSNYTGQRFMKALLAKAFMILSK